VGSPRRGRRYSPIFAQNALKRTQEMNGIGDVQTMIKEEVKRSGSIHCVHLRESRKNAIVPMTRGIEESVEADFSVDSTIDHKVTFPAGEGCSISDRVRFGRARPLFR
jgi:hypothetical protein